MKKLLKNSIHQRILFISIIAFVLFAAQIVSAQTTEFTYQGKLSDSSTPANANYDFEFRLYDTAAGGTLLGTLTRTGVAVSNGIFTVRLDFGAQFTGAARHLEIAVKPAGGATLTTLNPRQTLTSAPYSVRSLSSTTADTATDSQQLGGVAANQFTQTNDVRLTDSRNPNSGSGFYIQNQNSSTQTANFNISGNGTTSGTLSGNTVNSATQYNIGGSQVLSVAGNSNLFAGINAGASNTGFSNSFFGEQTGQSNTTGSQNSFFGANAGGDCPSPCPNPLTGSNNSFVGNSAGKNNTTGYSNSFFGDSSGGNCPIAPCLNPLTGSFNSFFGDSSGFDNTTGGDNSFVGNSAGENNTTGGSNTFFGSNAGKLNITGSNNTIIGKSASVSATNLTNATAIGANAVVSQNNSLVLGDFGVNVGIGTSAPTATLTVATSSNSTTENTATFKAPNIGPNQSHIHYGTNGDWFVRSAAVAGKVVLQDSGGSVGVGTAAPKSKLEVAGGDVYLSNSANGVILKSPNGQCWRVTVGNTGTLTSTAITCP